jgi:3-oxoacyl-[acyl-carrier protein] reductase/2-hydroxycyclohexanecarboxyl-CoA dehydrogenase
LKLERIEPMRLQNKVAVVTGAARGIGQAIALRFAAEGAQVVLNDLQHEMLEETARLVEERGGATLIAAADIGERDGAEHVVSEAIARFGRLDVWINNAGITRDALLMKMTSEQWEAVLRVNLTGTFNGCQAAAARMSTAGGGAIVNLSSRSYLGNIGQANYSASKAGVVGLTRTLALELARYSIRVNAIAPGFVDTEMARAVPEDVRERVVKAIPLRRMARPEEIANVALFLASEESSYITGQVLVVCGGRSVGGGLA